MKRIWEYLRKPDWVFIGVILLGLALRSWGINFGLPYTYASDEPTYLLNSLKIIQTGDLNPHWWFYPSLMFYLNVAALLAFFFAGRLTGDLHALSDLVPPEIIAMGVGKMTLPGELLILRGLNALFSTAAIVLVFLIARRLNASKLVAFLAAFLFAVSPTVIDHSQRVGPDIFAMFFSLLSFLFAVRILDDPRQRNYILAGIGAGLAIASKYNAGLILIPLVLAHSLRYGWLGLCRKELYIGLFATGLAFFIGTPFAVFDFSSFWWGVRWQAFSYSVEGHAGQEGDSLRWYVSYLWNMEGWVVLFSMASGIYFFFRPAKRYWLLLSFPLLYFLFVSQLLVRNARTIMQIIPFLDLLVAILIAVSYEWIVKYRQAWRPVAIAGLAAISALLVIPPAQIAIAANSRLTQVDGRETARRWLEANLPAGARVVLEAYSPYLDTTRFAIFGIDAIADRSPDWYIQNGFEYLVLSQGMYGRFFAEPGVYASWVAKYNQFFSRFPQVARFDDNGYEVRIYQTGVTLPPHRVAARFGDYGEHVELIGYDDVQWAQGEPLRMRLHWRTLDEKPEPFEVELRLLGPDDQEIAKARSDLFQGKGWREGMFDGVWTIPTPTDMAPGSYRLQVNVVWTRYAYSIPAQSWSEKKIDPVILEPIEMQARQ